MSAEIILLPYIIESLSDLLDTATTTGTRLGYSMKKITPLAVKPIEPRFRQIELAVNNSEVVANGLAEEEQLEFTKGNITITFKRDERKRLSVCVSGTTKTEEELRQAGTEFAHRLVQQYVYQKIKRELQQRKFVITEEETTPQNVIRLKVRHW
ncbi:MAG: hypothetical protein N3A72_05365 [bacterium]|nr:hypothetical protein [bacterium]